mmetsp:Transcript_5595/g.10564  ORF Transcript_5595/g.10564 Transcript_5595/m.10564 type:complete len:215 (+) Transcript_5595:632-1276(+)
MLCYFWHCQFCVFTFIWHFSFIASVFLFLFFFLFYFLSFLFSLFLFFFFSLFLSFLLSFLFFLTSLHQLSLCLRLLALVSVLPGLLPLPLPPLLLLQWLHHRRGDAAQRHPYWQACMSPIPYGHGSRGGGRRRGPVPRIHVHGEPLQPPQALLNTKVDPVCDFVDDVRHHVFVGVRIEGEDFAGEPVLVEDSKETEAVANAAAAPDQGTAMGEP